LSVVQRSRLTPDVLAGGLFLLVGLGVMFIAGDYPVGDVARMGPGYFPQLLGGLLALLGVIVLVMGVRAPPDRVAHRLFWTWLAVPVFWVLLAGFGRMGVTGLDLALSVLLVLAWLVSRPLFWVLAGVALFALSLEPLGLGLASLVLMLAARRAEPELSWRGAFAAWLVLLLVSLAIFVWGLGTPLPVWPRFMVT
jgi:hypothetical protein